MILNVHPIICIIIYIIVGIACGRGIVWIWRRPPVPRDAAEGDATQPFAEGDPIVGLLRPDGQRVTIHAGPLPDDTLMHLFGAHDVPLSITPRLGLMKAPYSAGISKVILDRVDREGGFIDLHHAHSSTQREGIRLYFDPEHRRMLQVLSDNDELLLICGFAEEPGVAKIGVFSPA